MILALDLGSNTGFAIWDQERGGAAIIGTWEFKNSRHEGGGSRYLRFRQHLTQAFEGLRVQRVFYEEVRAHKGTDAAHVYGGLLAVLTSFCEEREVPYEGVPVGTIKKHLTGKGNASKDMMIEAARELGYSVDNDNEADAVGIMSWARAERMFREPPGASHKPAAE